MLGPENLERFRKMTPAERLRVALHLREMGWRFLRRLPPAEAQRRLDFARAKNWDLPRRSERRS